MDASCPKGISLHVAAPSPRRRKNGERDSLSPFFLRRGEGAATQRLQRQNNQLSGALGVTHYSKIMSLALVNAKKLIIECSATAYTMYIDKKYAHTLQEPASRT